MDNTRVSACTTIHFQPSDNFIVLAAVSGKNLIESRCFSDFRALLPLPGGFNDLPNRIRSRVAVDDGGGANAGAPRRARVRRVLRKFARRGTWRSVCGGRTSAGLAADAGPRKHAAQALRCASRTGTVNVGGTACTHHPCCPDTGLPDTTASCPGGYISRHIEEQWQET
jgi:hypothetical protein